MDSTFHPEKQLLRLLRGCRSTWRERLWDHVWGEKSDGHCTEGLLWLAAAGREVRRWACWRWTAPDQCSRSGKERKAEGEWRRRVKTLSNCCKKDSAFAQETGSCALCPLPAVLLRVPICFSPFLRVYTGSWEPHLLKRLPFPPLSPLSTLTRSTFRHDWLLQDLDTLHPHQHPICN